MSEPGLSLWKDHFFRKYYILNVLTYFGAGISVVALPFYIYEQTESPVYTSLVSVFSGLPYLLFGLFAGALADRGDRKRIMAGCNLFCGLALATIPLAAALTGEAHVIHLLAAGLLTSTAFVWSDSASHGALLQLIGKRRLVAANSALISSDTVIKIGSPVMAGILIARFGAAWAIGVTALCYLLAAWMILSMKGTFRAEREESAVAPQTIVYRLMKDIREGIGYIWSEPLIRSLTLVGFGNGFVGGAVTGLIVVFGAETLGFADNAPQLSLLYTFGSIGALAASLSLTMLRRRYKPGVITMAGLAGNGLSLLGVAMSGSLYASCFCYLLWNLSNTLIIINGITLRQQLTPDHLQGRVHATGRMIAYGGTPIGSLFGGLAASSFGVVTVYALLAVAMLGIFGLAFRTALPRYVLQESETM